MADSPAPAPRPARRARDLFAASYDGPPDLTWFSPGRVNLIGEHTDYNEGFVLPLALPMGVGVAARRRDDGVLRAVSGQVDGPLEVALADLAPGAVEGWGAYVAGVAWALAQAGVEVPGADLALDSDVPPGAGLSSSHALECAVAMALLDLADSPLDRTAVARLVLRAENDFVGAATGIMDQMASLHGREDHLVFLDTRSLVVRHVPWDLTAHGLSLLVVDTNSPHALVDGEYAERRSTCAAAARTLGVEALRDVHLPALDDALGRLDDPVARRRVRHVVTEDARVLDVVGLLDSGADPRGIGPLLTASHASMRDDFEITVATVDDAVAACLDAGAHGARMTGGGFGGSVVALVEADAVEEVQDAVRTAYADAGHAEPAFLTVTAAAGSRRVD